MLIFVQNEVFLKHGIFKNCYIVHYTGIGQQFEPQVYIYPYFQIMSIQVAHNVQGNIFKK